MADLTLAWGADLALGSTGGLATLTGPSLTKQRLTRRLLTNPGAYIWDLTYGAGLPAYVGQPVDVAGLTAVITAQAMLEAEVASVTSVSVTQDDLGHVNATIVYVDASGSEQTLLVSTSPG